MQINQVQQQQNSNSAFGVHYTKRTVTRLKELTPNVIELQKMSKNTAYLNLLLKILSKPENLLTGLSLT